MGRDTSRHLVGLELQRCHGILRLRSHPDLRRAIVHLAERGLLVPIFPGVYIRAAQRDDQELRLRAASVWRPDAVLVGRAAAHHTFWPELPVPVIDLAVTAKQKPRAGVRFVRRRVPAAWRCCRDGTTVTRPALTAVDLIPELGGAVISTAVNRKVTMAQLWAALESAPHRPGHHQRRQVLRDYRDGPWSEAEQELHRQLRAAGISGWLANRPVHVCGQWHPLDVVFEGLKLAIEIDGYAFHGLSAETRRRYESDRAIASELVARGWMVLRFTWRQLVERPDWVIATIRAALRRARRAHRRTEGPLNA